MKLCVYGAGAIGGHLAVRLHRGGADVSVIARGPHLTAIQAKGLTVHAVDGTFTVPVRATANPAELGPQDAVFVTVKAPALPQVAASIAPLLKADTSVAFVMNGIPWWYCNHLGGPLDGRSLPRVDPGDVMRTALGPGRTIGGVVYSASAVVAPGVVEVEQPKSRIILGEPDGTLSDRVKTLAGLITAGGISGEATPAIRTEIWNKLISNLAGGTLAVLTGTAPKFIYTEPAAEAAALRMMQEAAAIAQALGADPAVNHAQRVANHKSMEHKPSILQDLELGRPMEVDGMFDAPLALARLAGVEAPTLELLVSLCKLRARASALYQ
ncbi:MAG TPA: 2-dehydropantoate 2-reductase [Rhodopila sp.]|uniref:ketopantoate reductase family protein n=1 Tax=Rhodopila sp. TaxID=2480087 RepID=UPI002C557265|nr:2-dehydropantoate 2-reductase [Rhodopila sp.]HVY18216.1 2-dehydropantoate 2-reductase [Rhodopila sp.]